MGDNNSAIEGKIEREKQPIKPIEVRLDEMEEWKHNIGEEFSELQKSSFDLKKELAQFVFQTVSTTMGLFVILLAVLIGFSANWNFKETGINYVIGLLIFLVVLISIYLIGWLYLNFWRKHGRA